MEDPGLFTLPCRLGDSKPFDTLADQGSYVNIIPLYLFKKLNIGLLEETDHIFGLADRTKSYPVGIVKDFGHEGVIIDLPVVFFLSAICFASNKMVTTRRNSDDDVPNFEAMITAAVANALPNLTAALRTQITNDIRNGAGPSGGGGGDAIPQ
ncbi:hypothetical protein Tco_0453139 [Tanacetum coccineum]